ncbi:PtdP, QbsJ [Thauera linaloolentis 47Lol = DSM 12138]|uniref:PtdP, QbsJ n=2 Tax=Thauera linaloolentis TaxID=76112 RepID=N6YFF8_THAL4|nr:PtdP, QbsJ [Thauera linaloolentis 47Lol = DSM 12138]
MTYFPHDPYPTLPVSPVPAQVQSCWDAQLACQDSDVLSLALELGLFTHLDEFATAEQVASQLALSPGNTRLFLEVLASMGVLEHTSRVPGQTAPAVYRTHPQMQPYLSPASSLYLGDALLFRHKVLCRSRKQLEVLLREGAPPRDAAPDETAQQAWARAARVQIAQEQRAITVPVARRIAGRLPDRLQWRTMLDLGGGPGLVAIALAQDLPDLSGVVYDYPSVAEVAQHNIEAAGLQGRLQSMGGNLAHDDFGCGYDLIWCSSVLHFVPDEAPVLQRLHAALKPGGVLLCAHAEAGDRRVLQYYLRMRMQGRQVLPEGALARQLRKAGFTDVTTCADVDFPVAPVTVLIARKGEAL